MSFVRTGPGRVGRARARLPVSCFAPPSLEPSTVRRVRDGSGMCWTSPPRLFPALVESGVCRLPELTLLVDDLLRSWGNRLIRDAVEHRERAVSGAVGLERAPRHLGVLRRELDADERAAETQGDDAGGARAGERIEDEIPRRRARLHAGLDESLGERGEVGLGEGFGGDGPDGAEVATQRLVVFVPALEPCFPLLMLDQPLGLVVDRLAVGSVAFLRVFRSARLIEDVRLAEPLQTHI